ncbi:MAG: nuclear transport factor 2 family protein [Propionibacteriaceae bacterium]
MTTDAGASGTEQLVRDYLQALFDRGDFGRHLSAAVTWTTMETGEEIAGRDHVVGFLSAMHTQIFDTHPSIRSLTVTGSRAVLEAELNGVHVGDLGGFPPTGEHFVAPYAVVYDVEDGAITAMRGYVPMTQMMTVIQAASDVPV